MTKIVVLRLSGENRNRVNRMTRPGRFRVQDLPGDTKRLSMRNMQRMSVMSDMLITEMSGTGRFACLVIILGSNVNLILCNWKFMDSTSGKGQGKCCWQGYKKLPREQEYGDEVGTGTSIEPSEEELADLSQACNRLWQLDFNRLEPGKDYQIDCGEGKRVRQKEDMAEESLFYSLSEDIFRKPTFSRFCALLDNYNPNAGCKEVVTTEEKQEQSAFIEEISRTAPIKYLHRTFGSFSAFEHVFVREIKQCGEEKLLASTIGFRCFYLEEGKELIIKVMYYPEDEGKLLRNTVAYNSVRMEWGS
ncbi:Chloroplast beta-amylase isoform 1 [Hibiscus syriacus]|uniref:Chloroplast beta-amylase isoform 1 n=1 Tax=Hibiscus syriacus TaxID=106335 RepID=A0A6A3AXF0_HIBSY|nr:Chloroplast beta-amylase isoform 1 [Hibiscus syriacus]